MATCGIARLDQMARGESLLDWGAVGKYLTVAYIKITSETTSTWVLQQQFGLLTGTAIELEEG
jgi:hypothetical protein